VIEAWAGFGRKKPKVKYRTPTRFMLFFPSILRGH
jgi:hypothetical protein